MRTYPMGCWVALVAVLGFQPAQAAPPAAINIHGQLLSPSGDPVTGSRVYTVQFHDASTAGNTLGGALTGSVDVSDEGLFNLSVEPPAAILAATEVWYSLGVDTDDPADNSASDDVFPSRIRVYSVPFALQAQEALVMDASGVGNGSVDNTELDALDGVTGGIQAQIDAIDTSGITTNAADIDQLEADVAAKANSTDVYTKAESDTNFVDAAGDTMSGALGVDTITEATANAGVTADGVTLRDSFVLLSPIAAPGDTTGKIYNVGGSLFFDGALLGGSTFDKDAINDSGTLGFDWLDAEVDDALTIAGGSVNNDSFSALSDLTAESAVGTGAGQVAAGNHGHNLQDLTGAVTDAQVPDNITISEADTLDSVLSRGATTDATIELNGLNQAINYTQAAGTFSINSDAAAGLTLEGMTVANGVLTSVTRVQASDGTAAAPSMTFLGDTNTGIHRSASDTLSISTGGTSRMTVDTTEVNFLGNILDIASGSAPGVTTNKLYNSSGNLFWNGTQLDAGGGGTDRDSLNWSVKDLDTPYNGFTQFTQKMPAAGTIVSVQAWCNYSSSDWRVDLRKNGSTVLSGPISFVVDTLVEGTLSDASFNQGDLLSLNLDNGTGFIYGVAVTIIVEY